MIWRPMNTAPRDGSKFWGNVDGDAITMFWMEEFDGFVSSYRQMVMAPGYTIDGKPFKNHSPVYHSPTGWMRLPTSAASDPGAERVHERSVHADQKDNRNPHTQSEGGER